MIELEIGQDVMERVGAVVLGGGRGTRLYPLTALRAKPAVPILGRYRLVDIPLSLCIHSGIKRIVVLTQFNSASLHRHISNSYRFDHFSGGSVEILAAEQSMESGDWFQGTADAVRKQLRHIRDLRTTHYLILSGDHLYSMDYRKLMKTHLESNADITVATTPVATSAARGFGIMHVFNNGRIKDFIEKPSESELERLITPANVLKRYAMPSNRPYLASMGIYLCRADVLEEILETRQDWIDFGRHVIPQSLRNRKVFAHLFNGYWEDIGTVRSYYEVHMRMVSPNLPFQSYASNHIIYTRPRYLPGSRLHDARISDSIVCEGSRIQEATISNSIIGIRSVIQSKVKIDHSVIMGADYVETESELRNTVPLGIGTGTRISTAIVDKNARIGKNVVIRGSQKMKDYDGDGFAIRDGIVVVMKNAVIPDGTRIE